MIAAAGPDAASSASRSGRSQTRTTPLSGRGGPARRGAGGPGRRPLAPTRTDADRHRSRRRPSMSVLSRSALESSPLADLHAIASELGIDGFRRLRKAELIDRIVAHQGGDGDDDATLAEEVVDEAAAEPEARPRRRRGGRGRARSAADEEAEADADAEVEVEV